VDTRHTWFSYCLFLSFSFAVAGFQPVYAQDVFSSGSDNNTNQNDSNGGGPDQFGSNIPQADCFGVDRVWVAGRCNARQPTSYIGCGPWYGYNNFLRSTLDHYAGNCEFHNGNQLWCHQRQPGMCNPDLGGLPEEPLVDTGVRYDANCQFQCDRTVAPGSKGLIVQPVTSAPKGGDPVDARLIENINRCFSTVHYYPPVSYYLNPRVSKRTSQSSSDRPVSYANGTLVYDPAVLDRQPLATKVFLLAHAMAQHAQILHYQKFGPDPGSNSYVNDEDTIVGFVDRCLMDKGLISMPENNSPEDPRILYGEFLGDRSQNSARVDNFSRGFQGWPLFPLSLLPHPR
jgi:hypothetical protein